ncbi:MAG TPA: hypothetical protein VK325_00940 [Pseudoxanthomonas sp.]|nr:hypothetical protein [Pseudoxanthomonas sp.]
MLRSALDQRGRQQEGDAIEHHRVLLSVCEDTDSLAGHEMATIAESRIDQGAGLWNTAPTTLSAL